MPYRFVFDINKCTGCQACQVACLIENQVAPENSWRNIVTYNQQRFPNIPLYHLSLACNHCIDATCQKACPANVYSRDEKTGALLINTDACIGCKYCSWVCPYDAPRYNKSIRGMEKCTFCNHRLQEGFSPACVSLCPTGALKHEEYTTYEPPYKIEGFPDTGINPAINIIPLRKNNRIPEMDQNPFPKDIIDSFNAKQKQNNKRISLLKEWTLVVFTLLVAFMTGLYTASVFTPLAINPFFFSGLAFVSIVVSSFHLGKKHKAMSAILNWKTSWLSREIIFYTFFILLATINIFAIEKNMAMGIIAILLGFFTLHSIDKIYSVINPKRGNVFHSAEVTLTALHITTILSSSLLASGFITLLKAALYLVRIQTKYEHKHNFYLIPSIIRVLFGFFIPIGLIAVSPEDYLIPAMISLMIGEIIDRSEFYLELEFITPEMMMKDATRKAVAKL